MRNGIAVLSAVMLLCSCRADPPPLIWQSQLPSPDGRWTAMAYTTQNGGFGSASIHTVVQLKRGNGTTEIGKAHDVLAFDCYGPAARAYTLSDENSGGTIHLNMHWIDPTHLAVSYDGRADVKLQEVRFADVNISLAVLPKDSAIGPV